MLRKRRGETRGIKCICWQSNPEPSLPPTNPSTVFWGVGGRLKTTAQDSLSILGVYSIPRDVSNCFLAFYPLLSPKLGPPRKQKERKTDDLLPFPPAVIRTNSASLLIERKCINSLPGEKKTWQSLSGVWSFYLSALWRREQGQMTLFTYFSVLNWAFLVNTKHWHGVSAILVWLINSYSPY